MFNKSNCPYEAQLEELTKEYQAELAKRGLPQMSADELLHEDLSPDDRRYVSDFYQRWNLVENAMAEEHRAFARAEQEAFDEFNGDPPEPEPSLWLGPEFADEVSLEERWEHYAFEERNGMPYGSSF